MPRLIWSRTALRALARLREFLREKDYALAERAYKAIREGVKTLETFPEIGRPVPGLPSDVRERVISFGHYAYIVRYFADERQVVILNVRHGRELEY